MLGWPEGGNPLEDRDPSTHRTSEQLLVVLVVLVRLGVGQMEVGGL